ncbi:MAG: homoserine O-acetyltransferase [Cytophagaceae bacterium]
MENFVFESKSEFILESGKKLSGLKINYSAAGKLNQQGDNVIWICHALTANSDVSAWWEGMIGAGKIFDTSKYFVVCANILGSCYGTTGPIELNPDTAKPYFGSFPQVTIRDMVECHEILRNHLKIKSIHTCIGGSLGGQQALEWAIIQPDLILNLILLATNAFHSPWGIAFNESQRMAIKADPTWTEERVDAGREGLKAARAIALLSYRNYYTYECSQSEEDYNKTDEFKSSSYQQYQGEKLVNRFNCHSYLILSKAMDSHNVGRGRNGVVNALSSVKAKTLVIGIKSDVLFPVSEQIFLSEHIPYAIYKEIDSIYGHDGFLIETERIQSLISEFYALDKAAVRSIA